MDTPKDYTILPTDPLAGMDTRTDIQRINDLLTEATRAEYVRVQQVQLIQELQAENKELKARLLKLGYSA